VAVAATLVIVVAGCGDDDGDEARDTTSTEAGAGTTTTASSTSGSSETTTGGTGASLGDSPTFAEDAASGSGCAPGEGDLPDGWWYGRISAAPTTTLGLDLACFYVGAAAEAEAASRGDEVNNDYYVVNDNPTVRSLPVAAGAVAECVDLEPTLTMVACGPAEVAADWTVWVRVVDGEVDRILEQYLP
jgi:hypothetical protein